MRRVILEKSLVSYDNSLLGYFVQAGSVVKLVMLLLLAASIFSWTLIFQRIQFLRRIKRSLLQFQERFWSGEELSKLYSEMNKHHKLFGINVIFVAGFKEFLQLYNQSKTKEVVIQGTQRAMRIAQSREMDRLENNLSLLATIGSTSPYVGLFGTVWGIMTSFHALGSAQQATIAMVAPGISEALIATAMGLFAAIPAVIAYNRFIYEAERLLNSFETFQDEFITLLERETYKG